MHPGNQSDALFRSICFQHQTGNGIRGSQDGFVDDGYRDPAGMIEALDNGFTVIVNLLQWPLPVEMLTTGDKPYFPLNKWVS